MQLKIHEEEGGLYRCEAINGKGVTVIEGVGKSPDEAIGNAVRELHLVEGEVSIDDISHADCDHDWEVIDQSFDHEYGTERIVFEQCMICDEQREHEPRTFDDDVI